MFAPADPRPGNRLVPGALFLYGCFPSDQCLPAGRGAAADGKISGVLLWTIDDEEEAGRRLDAWLASRPEVGSRGRALAAIERGKVFLNGEEVVFSDAGHRLAAGDRVGYWPDRPGSASPRPRAIVASRQALDVVHQDAQIVVVNKPSGWLVEPLPREEAGEVTLLDLLADHLRCDPRQRPHVVHRIDRDTTGLVLFALTSTARDHLKSQFEHRTAERIYLAVAGGVVLPAAGTWRDRLVWDKKRLVQHRAGPGDPRAKDAVAHYRVLEQFEDAAVLEVSLVTGKRNQIRVQAGERGHALLGERIYAGGARPHAFPRQALHAARLAFIHPATGRRVAFTAPVPDDLAGLIARLRDAHRR